MTSTVKLSTIVEYTGLSPRYWQRRVAAGEVPGARELPCGARRVFLLDFDVFKDWWSKQGTKTICPRTFDAGAPLGGSVSVAKARSTKARSRRTTSRSLVDDLKKFAAG